MKDQKQTDEKPENKGSEEASCVRSDDADTGEAAKRAAGKSGQDRLDAIKDADDRTQKSTREKARDVGAETPGGPGEQLSQPRGDGNYVREGDLEAPLREQNGLGDEQT